MLSERLERLERISDVSLLLPAERGELVRSRKLRDLGLVVVVLYPVYELCESHAVLEFGLLYVFDLDRILHGLHEDRRIRALDHFARQRLVESVVHLHRIDEDGLVRADFLHVLVYVVIRMDDHLVLCEVRSDLIVELAPVHVEIDVVLPYCRV